MDATRNPNCQIFILQNISVYSSSLAAVGVLGVVQLERLLERLRRAVVITLDLERLPEAEEALDELWLELGASARGGRRVLRLPKLEEGEREV